MCESTLPDAKVANIYHFLGWLCRFGSYAVSSSRGEVVTDSIFYTTELIFSVHGTPDSPSSSGPTMSVVVRKPEKWVSVNLCAKSIMIPTASTAVSAFYPRGMLVGRSFPLLILPGVPVYEQFPRNISFGIATVLVPSFEYYVSHWGYERYRGQGSLYPFAVSTEYSSIDFLVFSPKVFSDSF